MKTLFKVSLIALGFLLSFSCSKDNDFFTGATITLYETNGDWECNLDESCQDVYEFKFKSNTNIDITISEVTGGSESRLAVYAPNVSLGGINLLTNSTKDFSCVTINDESIILQNINLPKSGVYKIAVTREFGESVGDSGTYKLTVSANSGFQYIEQTIDDVDSLADGFECPQ